MARAFRRIVTGHNTDGKSIFLMDGPASSVVRRGTGATVATDLWKTLVTPASNVGNDDPTIGHPFCLPPPPNGTVFRIVEYPPDEQRAAALREAEFKHASDAASGGYTRDLKHARHPGFHKTSSIDYAIVMSGEIYALVDEGELLLRAGDILIQRGTNHAWSNRSNEPCQVAFILIDAKPV